MKNIIKILLSVFAIALSLFLGMNAEKLFVSNLNLVTIPIPNQEIEPYTILQEDMFTTKEFSSFIQDFDYASSFSELQGRMTTATLAQGLPVPMAFISQSTGFYLDDPKLEIVSIPVTPAQMIGGNIYPGQNINLYINEAVSGTEAAEETTDDGFFTDSVPAADAAVTPVPETDAAAATAELPAETVPAESSEAVPETSSQDQTHFETREISNLKVSAVLDQYGNDIYAADSDSSSEKYASIVVLAVRPDQAKTIVDATISSMKSDSATSLWITIANSK